MGSKSGNSRNGLNDVRYSRPTATNLLSRIDPEDFKLLRVGIRRHNITATGPLGCLERDVDEPSAITPLVHKVNSKVNLPLFGHNIEVNKEFEQQQPKEKPQENRFVLADANRAEEEREKYKPSRSPSRQRRVSRSRSRERYNFREKERRSRSRSRSRSPDVESRKRHTLSRPLRPGEYVPNHPDLKTRRARSRSTEKREQRSHSRERTVKPSTSDPKSLRLYSRSPGRRSRSRSKTPARYDRDRKRSRSPRRRSPSRSRYRSRSRSPRYERRRSRSPYRPRYGRPMEMVPPEYAFYPHWNPMGPMGPGMMPHQYMPPPGMIRNPYMFAPRMPYQPFPRMNMMSKLRPPSTVVGTSATITDIKQINKDADIENLKDKIESEKSAVEEKDKAEEPVPEISLSN